MVNDNHSPFQSIVLGLWKRSVSMPLPPYPLPHLLPHLLPFCSCNTGSYPTQIVFNMTPKKTQ